MTCITAIWCIKLVYRTYDWKFCRLSRSIHRNRLAANKPCRFLEILVFSSVVTFMPKPVRGREHAPPSSCKPVTYIRSCFFELSQLSLLHYPSGRLGPGHSDEQFRTSVRLCVYVTTLRRGSMGADRKDHAHQTLNQDWTELQACRRNGRFAVRLLLQCQQIANWIWAAL